MTDKIQKIKDWISKTQDGLMDAQGNFERPEHEGAYHILCSLDYYIHSLQEEPVSKDYRERYKRIAESEEFRKNYDGMSIGDIVPVEEQEPASEDLEKIVEEIAEPTILNAYGTKELARRLRNTICGISISEDLGEYINELSKQFPEVSFAKLSRIAVRVAKWQKQKDDGEIKMVRELLADFDKHCDEYHEAGFKHGQEALMKDATETTVHIGAGNYPYIPQIELYDYDKDVPLAKEGDRYKVILIKES